jgi:hypothetical protein
MHAWYVEDVGVFVSWSAEKPEIGSADAETPLAAGRAMRKYVDEPPPAV